MSIFDKLKRLIVGARAEPVEQVPRQAVPHPEQAQTSKASDSERVSRMVEEKAQLAQELFDALGHIVICHGKALDTKMRQLCYQDAYGNNIFDKFYVERDYFIKNVMCRDVPSTIIDFLFSPEPYNTFVIRLFHESLARFLETRGPQPLQRNTAAMSPVEYEQYCADLLEAAGWTTRLTKAVGDQGVDVIATFESIKVVGQCKLHSNPVGNAAAQEIIAGREFEQADYAFVASNSTFTPAARTLASTSGVLLVHDSELGDLHNRLNISIPERKPDSGTTCAEVNDQAIGRASRPINELLQQVEALRCKWAFDGYDTAEDDPLYPQAVEVVLQTRRASTSLVQRQLKIGYNRADRLIEQMERDGLVSPMNAVGSREVLT